MTASRTTQTSIGGTFRQRSWAGHRGVETKVVSEAPAQDMPAGLLARRMPALAGLLSVPGFIQLCLSNALAQAFGQRLQSLAVAWLVLDMTDSKMTLGLINGAPAISIVVFSLLGGVLADSGAARRLLILTRSALFAAAFVTATLVAAGLIRPEHLLIYMLLVVGLGAIDMPVARTFMQGVAGTGGLLSATATQSIFTGLVNMAGPVSIGLLITLTGAGSAFAVLAAGYALAVLLLTTTSTSAVRKAGGSRPVADLVAGIAYIRANPTIATLAGLGFLLPIAGVYFAMVPVYAREVLHVGASGLGVLAASFAFGSLVSSTYLAASGRMNHRGMAIAGLGVVFGAGMIAFAMSNSFLLSCLVSMAMGVTAGFWQNTLSTLVQLVSVPEMRGRVVGVFTMGFQLVGLGWLIGGILGAFVGIEAALALSGGVFAAVSIAAIVFSRGVRELD